MEPIMLYGESACVHVPLTIPPGMVVCEKELKYIKTIAVAVRSILFIMLFELQIIFKNGIPKIFYMYFFQDEMGILIDVVYNPCKISWMCDLALSKQLKL